MDEFTIVEICEDKQRNMAPGSDDLTVQRPGSGGEGLEFWDCHFDDNAEMSEERMEETSKLNPLLLEDTLEIILSQPDFTFMNLKEFRSVNSVWNEVATRLMVPHCKEISFDGIDRGLAEMRSLVELLRTSQYFPVRKFSIFMGALYQFQENPTHPLNARKNQRIVTGFFQAVAPFVQNLELNQTLGAERPLFPEGLPAVDLHFPHLIGLTFVLDDPFTDHPVLFTHTQFVMNIVKNAHRLTDLHPGTHRSGQSGRHIAAIIACMPLRNRQRIERLSLEGHITDDTLHGWLSQGVRSLKQLYVRLNDRCTVSQEVLQSFLQAQSRTLQALCIECLFIQRDFLLQLPILPNLMVLEISSLAIPQTENDLLRIEFKEENFPILEKLALKGNLDTFFNPTLDLMETVKELKLRSPLKDEWIIREIAETLPNLQKLSLCVAPGSLTLSQFGQLDNVEELVLWSCDDAYNFIPNCDKMFTGLVSDEFTKWRWWSQISDWLFKILGYAKGKDPAQFLQRIKKLSIKGESSVGLSDVSCRLVLLKLPNLACLDLLECEKLEPGISSSVLGDLQNKLTLRLTPDSNGWNWRTGRYALWRIHLNALVMGFIYFCVCMLFWGNCELGSLIEKTLEYLWKFLFLGMCMMFPQ